MASSPLTRKNRILSALGTCAAACGMTLLLLAAVYALRGIWPFGTDNVAYMDTAQFYIPNYYRTWDAMHGQVSSGLNWYEGLAMMNNPTWKAFLYPYNWAFLLVSRDHVLEGLSLYLAIHLLLVALSASLVLSIRFPRVSVRWRVLLTLIYTFSGYVLQYYSNFHWFWVVTLFPLVLLGLERLLREGKYVLYAVMCWYFISGGLYFTFMLAIFTVLFSLGYCLFLLPRDKRGSRIFQLGMCTAVAYILNYRQAQASASEITQSSRFQENLDSGLMAGMTTWDLTNTRHTFLMLLGTAVLFAVLLHTVRSASPERRARLHPACRFFCYMAVILVLPMVFTNMDTAWHFGQYSFFPMRYGFVVPGTLIGFAGAALEFQADQPPAPAALPESGPRKKRLLAAAAALAVLAVFLPRTVSVFRQYGACFLNLLGARDYLIYFAGLALCGAAFALLYYLLLNARRGRAGALVLSGLVLFQLGANACGLLAPDDSLSFRHEYDPAYIEKADSLYDYFSSRDVSPLSRAKNVDCSLNGGYPCLAGVSALSSVYDGNSATFLGVFRELGYTVSYCRVLDVGGTVFTDMLLGVDRVLSERPLDGDLYLAGDTVDGIQVGACRYPGALGLTYDPADMEDYFQLETIPDRLNALYRAFAGPDGTLARALRPEMTVEGTGAKSYTLTCRLDKPAFLYMSSSSMLSGITVDGEPVAVPTYQNLENRFYPAIFNSNLLCLGLFQPGTVQIGFTSVLEVTEQDMVLLGLDQQALDDFYALAGAETDLPVEHDKNGLTLTVSARREGLHLFLPLTGSWICTVNGQFVTPASFLGTMLSIPLQEGENQVSVYRTSDPGPALHLPTVDRSNALSALCLALCVVWLVLRRTVPKVRALTVPKPLGAAALALFYLSAAAVATYAYLLPLFLLIRQGTVLWF